MKKTIKRLLAQTGNFKALLFITLAMAALAVNAQEGTWSGELDIYGTKLLLVFNFDKDGCTMDSPSQGAKGIKAEKSVTSDGKLRVAVPIIGAVFEGTMEENKINGIFTQSGMSFPLKLKPGVEKAKRPQTPIGPFPYSTEEITFNNGEITLNGILTLPQNYNKNTPVVLMVTGSGQQNRDEELFEHKPFAVIADAFARQGIATLRCDDRGYNDKDFPFYQYTTIDFKCDALAAINLLRKRFNKIGVLGHSEGGTIALMLASEGEVDFAISLAGMATSGKETLLKQNEVLLSSAGVPDDIVTSYCKALDNGFEDLLKGKNVDEITVPEMPENLRTNLVTALKQSSTPYILHLLTMDVRDSLPKVKCPVLALNGTKDMQVNCEINLEAIDKGLINSKHKIIAVDGVNHLFQHCKTGIPSEYQQIEETFAPEVINNMIEWIKNNI